MYWFVPDLSQTAGLPLEFGTPKKAGKLVLR